jgi:hypothetical protein
LRAALVAQRDGRGTELRTGQVVAATSYNQHSTSFSAPSQVGLSPGVLFELWQELIDLYDECAGYLTGTPGDDDILAEMLHRLPAGPIPVCNDYTGVLP